MDLETAMDPILAALFALVATRTSLSTSVTLLALLTWPNLQPQGLVGGMSVIGEN